MKRVCVFALYQTSYALLRRVAVLRTYMRLIVTDQAAWSVGLSVGLSVCHTSEPCKNGRSDPDVVWVEDRVGPRNHILHAGPDPPWKGGNFEGKGPNHCKVWGHSAVSCAKTAKPIEVPFGLRARMGPRNHVLDGGPDPLCEEAILVDRGADCKV